MIRIILFALALLVSLTAQAHKPSDSYLTIQGSDEFLTVQWDIALKDLEHVIGLDDNHNGSITWGEVKSKQEAIVAYALSHLQINADDQACEFNNTDLLIEKHTDGAYASLALSSQCPGNAANLSIYYNLLFDVDPTHRGLLRYTSAESDSTHVLTPETPALDLQTADSSLWKTFVDYLIEGVWHIWIGYDHILFLLMLLLPAVLVYQDKRWHSAESFHTALIEALKLITAFTIAHSITLTLAVIEFVHLPSRLVESVIALSIIITALNNLWPVFPLSRWWLGFGFGLMHGFGFANVLLDLGLSQTSLAVSLLGFNLGVEVGQIAIAAVFFPLAFLLRDSWLYRGLIFWVGSLIAILISSVWVYERVLNQQVFNF